VIQEAMLYEKLPESRVQCHLCAHQCKIIPSKRGLCGVRENKGGILYSLVYGLLIAENVDPIEKKPLFHVYPGSRSFSIATVGCNFTCVFCQNHDISQMPRETLDISGQSVSPLDIVERAIRTESKSISYTYTEPTIYFEYAYDIAKLARERQLKNAFVTNGFMTVRAIDRIAPYLDAANVDLKSFRDDFYKNRCGARLQPVLDSLKNMKERGIWVEVTTLLIPGLNDREEELQQIAGFISSLGRETPWHISRFYPRYKMNDIPATNIAAIQRASEIGKAAGLKYVYSGNVPGNQSENTFCSHCGGLLIERYGYTVRKMHLKGSACLTCETPLDGIFQNS
jgi:pyruvate formate lyase activating enzyme